MWKYINEVWCYSTLVMDCLHLGDSRLGSHSTKYDHCRIKLENTTRNSHLKLWVKIRFLFFKTTLGCHNTCFHFIVEECALILRCYVSKHLEVRCQRWYRHRPREADRWIGTERKKADVTNAVSLSGRSRSVPALLFSTCLGSILDPSSVPSCVTFGNLTKLSKS